jgi:hypothetical protein
MSTYIIHIAIHIAADDEIGAHEDGQFIASKIEFCDADKPRIVGEPYVSYVTEVGE